MSNGGLGDSSSASSAQDEIKMAVETVAQQEKAAEIVHDSLVILGESPMASMHSIEALQKRKHVLENF